jgi:hypothetical protein
MGISGVPLEPQPVVGGVNQIQARAQVAFGGLHTGMAEQELNLFQFPAPGAAQLGAGPSQVVVRKKPC